MRLKLCQPSRLRAPMMRTPVLAGHPLAARRGSSFCRARRRLGVGLTLVARSSGDLDSAATDPPKKPTGWLTFYTAVDVGAWLGAVGAAAAFLITQEAMLAAAPVVLPLLALYASKQRERLAAEVSQSELDYRSRQLLERVAQLARGAAGEAAATEIARAVELTQQAGAASATTLRAVEAKLAAVEGSVLSTGSTTREALKESSAAQGRLAKDSMARLEALATAVRRDVATELRQTGAEEVAALSRVEARLASLEGAIRSIEAAQGDGLRRLSGSVTSALLDAEESLEAVVRAETARSLEPLRRLPELLAAAMPVTPVEVLSPERQLPQLSEDSVRELVGQQLAAATREILAQQAALLRELRQQAPAPATIAPAQWNQLGGRLVALQGEVQALLAAQQAQQQAQAPAPDAELAAQLAALRADVAALGSSLETLTQLAAAQGARNPVLPFPPGQEEGEGAEGASTAEQQQEQQEQLAEVVRLLQGLAGRLDGLGEQVAAAVTQQAQQGAASWQLPAQPPAPAAETAAAAEDAEVGGKEDAYRRMQALLAGRAEAPSSSMGAEEAAGAEPIAEAGGEGGPAASESAAAMGEAGREQEQPALPIRDWLSGGAGGSRAQAAQQQAEPATTASSAVGATDGASWTPAVPSAEPASSSNGARASSQGAGGGGAAPYVQSKIQYEAALGLYAPEEDEGQAAAGGSGVAFGSGAAPARQEEAGAAAPGSWQGEPAAATTPAQEQQQQLQEPQQQLQPEWAPGYAAAAAAAAAEGVAGPGQPAVCETDAAPAAPPSGLAPPGPSEVWMPQEPGPPASPEMPAGSSPSANLAGMSPEELAERGRQRLREGRDLAAASGADLGWADSLLWEAEECFESALAQQPSNVKALGNLGNALMARARLKLQMLRLLRSQAAATAASERAAAEVAAAQERLKDEAQSLLLMAGRRYKSVLEQDASQQRAFVNWGRVICLRADMARDEGRLEEAAGLFSNAADKYDAALDLDRQNLQALQLGGMALLDMATCLVDSDRKQAKQLLKDAEGYLEMAALENPQDLQTSQKLQECRQWAEYLRGTRYSTT